MKTQASSAQLSLDLIGGLGRLPERGSRPRRARGIGRCESPLEEQLCLALANTSGFRWRDLLDHPWLVGGWDSLELSLLAQPQCGVFRPDFALARAGWLYPEPLSLVVEVDGHAFHERTPAQAERDRSRDRSLVSQGITVLRFTGREVWRDAGCCAREALTLAARM